MNRFYKKALDKLNIDQQVFDRIVFSSEEVEDKIVECLEYCFENVESLEYVSCFLLQYIAEKKGSIRKDEDGDDNNSVHGNTRLPYGIAKSEGIDTTGMTPSEVWDKLSGKGYDPKEEYRKLGGKNPEKKKLALPKSREVPEAQKRSIRNIAKKTRGLRKEQYRIVDRDGNVVFEQRRGDRSQVATTVGEKRNAFGGDRSKGMQSIHNHPDGGTFTAADLKDFGFGAVSINAASPEGTYRLTDAWYGNDDVKEYSADWVGLRDALEEAQESFPKNSLENRKEARKKYKKEYDDIHEISEKWLKRKEEGADEDELNGYVEEYNKMSSELTKKVDEEERQILYRAYDEFYKKNAERFGFIYEFDPADGGKNREEKEVRNVAKVSESMKPESTDYEYESGESFEEFSHKNRKKLMDIYKQKKMDGVREEFYKYRMAETTKDLHETSPDDANEILSRYIRQSDADGWFRSADSNYKPRIVVGVLSSPEARNAALSVMWDNYKTNKDASGEKVEMSYEEWLVTPMKMYRGGTAADHTTNDIFSAYTPDRKVAEKFSVAGNIYEADIKPIDTFGSVFSNGEMEIMVPSMIAPNGNKDGRYDSDEDDEWDFREDKKQNAKEIREAKKKNYKTPDGKPIAGFREMNGTPVPVDKGGNPIGELGEKIKENESKSKEVNKNVLTEKEKDDKIEESEAERKIRLAEEKRKRKAEAKEEAKRIELQQIEADKNREAELKNKKKNQELTREEKRELSSLMDKSRSRRLKEFSPTGKNPGCTGFESEEILKEHHRRHGVLEMGIQTEEEYVRRANELLTKECGGNIDGYMDNEGAICRFNRETGEYVKGYPNGFIKTYFIPKYFKRRGERNQNWKSDAIRYFDGVKGRESYVEGS